ncbi:MAG: type II toxin-antitoxin system VapC family toxin [Candidatus Rokubacteria bacterium]|nr:type II toxin-antitoxin system VapC family toxin [Candidatus Rokubacteria bacterium]
MKVVDANLLLYATDRRSPRHEAARSWLEGRLSGDETIGFAWVVLLAFLRLSTNPHVFERPLSVERALDVVDGWLGQPCAVIVQPGDRHPAVVRQLLRPLGTAGNLVNDAHLAALAIEHGAELNSCDADFSRFSGLRWVNPLDSP